MLSYQVEENLEIRLVSERYAEELAKVVNENLEHISKWMAWATDDYSIDSAKEFIKMNRERYVDNDIIDHLIFEDGKLVGNVGFNSPNSQNKSIEIGYWLSKDATGKGIITKCCRILIDFVFEELRFNRIVIKCATENTKSQAIPERLGFTEEGIERQAEHINEEFLDWKIYSLLKDEWEEQSRQEKKSD